MSVWLLAILLLGLFGGIGYALGSIRTGLSFIGALIALAVAGPIGKLITPLFPKMGTEHAIWLMVLPPFVAFLLVWLIALGIGFAVHRPIELHYKYKEDDATRIGFEGLNKALGLFVGLLTGIILFFSLGKMIYPAGYLTTQTSAENESGPLGILNQLRQDMSGSGWDKVFAALDRTPKKFYQVSDALGLLYHNPLAHGRAAAYPPFLGLTERQEFKDISADTELLNQLTTKGSFMAITGNPKFQAALNSTELKDELMKTDLVDFNTYMETGKSPSYEDDKILGRWRFDNETSFRNAKRTRQGMTASEIGQIRYLLTNILNGSMFTAYVDGRAVLNVSAPAPAAAAPAEPDPAAAAAAPPAGGMDPRLRARYGLPSTPANGAAPPAPRAAPVAENPYAKMTLARNGKWERAADVYRITGDGAKGEEWNAVVRDGVRLEIPVPSLKFSLFFVRSF